MMAMMGRHKRMRPNPVRRNRPRHSHVIVHQHITGFR